MVDENLTELSQLDKIKGWSRVKDCLRLLGIECLVQAAVHHKSLKTFGVGYLASRSCRYRTVRETDMNARQDSIVLFLLQAYTSKLSLLQIRRMRLPYT